MFPELLSCEKVLVPLVVIAALLSIKIGEVALSVILVTLPPPESSPDGIKFHVVPSLIKVSPTFATWPAYVPAVITL